MPRVAPFDAYSSRYERWFEGHRAAYDSEVAALTSIKPGGGRWLEVGVGTGRFSVPLDIVWGVEPSRAMGRIARGRGIEVVRAVAESLPFPNASFDGVLFVTTICFVDDLSRSLAETHRILRPSCSLLIGFVDRESTAGRAYWRRRAHTLFYRSATFYSPRELAEAARRVGFREFLFAQTIFRPLNEVREPEPVKVGYGQGSFVVMRARSS